MLPMIPETVFPYGTWRKLDSMLISLAILVRAMFCATQIVAILRYLNVLLLHLVLLLHQELALDILLLLNASRVKNLAQLSFHWKTLEIVKSYKTFTLQKVENQKFRRETREKFFSFIRIFVIIIIITSSSHWSLLAVEFSRKIRWFTSVSAIICWNWVKVVRTL